MPDKLFFFAEATTFPCKCGKIHHIPTKKTMLGKEVLPRIPQTLSELNLGKKLLLLLTIIPTKRQERKQKEF